MNVQKTALEGVYIIEPKVFGDERGFFFESFRDDVFQKEIGNITFVQDNHSKSRKGILRGLHFQKPPHTQSKLVRVVQGAVLDVAVDLRKASPTFGKYVAVELSAENKRQLFIPQGFAHGFLTLSETAEFLYKCDDYYHPEAEGGLLWSDPAVGIPWGVDAQEVQVNARDGAFPTLQELESPF